MMMVVVANTIFSIGLEYLSKRKSSQEKSTFIYSPVVKKNVPGGSFTLLKCTKSRTVVRYKSEGAAIHGRDDYYVY